MPKQRIEQFQDKLSRLFHVGGAERLAKTVTFQVTEDCNLACTYCYQIHKTKNVMPFDIAKRFIDMLLEADYKSNEYINSLDSPGVVIEFIGGEPFLEIDLIDKITEYFIGQMIARKHKWATRYMISICSNGLLYFDEKVQRYISKYKNRLSFSISIDGNKELHDACRVLRLNAKDSPYVLPKDLPLKSLSPGGGSYDLAIAGVKHFTNVLGGQMGSKMTLAPENVMHTSSAVISLIENGYTEINLNCVYESGWDNEHATVLYNQLKELAQYMLDKDIVETCNVSMFEEHFFKPKNVDELQNWCGGTGHMIAVDYKGDLYPCLRYMESSLGGDMPPLIIGNVYDGIGMSTEYKQCIECIKRVDRRTQSTDECFYCPIAEGCAWCSAYNYQVMGTVDKRATFICGTHKARALANVYLWNKYYLSKGINRILKNYVPEKWAAEIISDSEISRLKKLEDDCFKRLNCNGEDNL